MISGKIAMEIKGANQAPFSFLQFSLSIFCFLMEID